MATCDKPPVFIGGLYKSGTSLLRAMLGQHSSIAAGLETYWFDLNWQDRDAQSFRDHISRLCSFYDISEALAKDFVQKSSSPLQFLDHFLSAYARQQRKSRWAEKTPGNILHVDEIFTAFPEARFIHIVRDPKDVLASLRQAKKWDSVPVFSELWCRFFGAAASVQAEERLFRIRYERLILDPCASMQQLLQFIGEPWEERVAQFTGKKDEYDKVLELTGKSSTTLDRLRQSLTSERLNVWQQVLSMDEIDALRQEISTRGVSELFGRIEQETLAILGS